MDQHREVILITGSSGTIGFAAVKRLAEVFTIVGFDSGNPPHPPTAAECVCVDLTSDEMLEAGLRRLRYAYGDRIASVIHLAAYYSFSGEPSPKYEQVTVRGTQRLLRGLKGFGFKVGQFVFSSTMLVHEPTVPGQPIDEDWPLKPKWAYPQSKVETEQLIRAERGDIPVVLLRIAGVYDDRCHSIPLAHQIQRIYEKRLASHAFPGDTSHGQAFIHLDDLIEAIHQTVRHRSELPAETTLLIGEPETLSYGHLQQALGRLIHGQERWQTRQIPKPLAKIGAWLQSRTPGLKEPFIQPWMIDLADDHYELNVSRAADLLDWRPQRSLLSALPKMVAALQTNPLGWYRDHRLELPSWPRKAAAAPREVPSASEG